MIVGSAGNSVNHRRIQSSLQSPEVNVNQEITGHDSPIIFKGRGINFNEYQQGETSYVVMSSDLPGPPERSNFRLIRSGRMAQLKTRPNAKIKLTNRRGITRTIDANSMGEVDLSNLSSGVYQISVNESEPTPMVMAKANPLDVGEVIYYNNNIQYEIVMYADPWFVAIVESGGVALYKDFGSGTQVTFTGADGALPPGNGAIEIGSEHDIGSVIRGEEYTFTIKKAPNPIFVRSEVNPDGNIGAIIIGNSVLGATIWLKNVSKDYEFGNFQVSQFRLNSNHEFTIHNSDLDEESKKNFTVGDYQAIQYLDKFTSDTINANIQYVPS